MTPGADATGLAAFSTKRNLKSIWTSERNRSAVSSSPSVPGRRPVVCAGVLVADHLCTPIPRLPVAGELVQADELVLNIGGCASNAAVVLSKLGVRATICGKVGDDVFGRFVADTLVGYGVDVSALAVDRTHATSQTLIVNVQGEDRRFIHAVGANRALTVNDLDPLLDPPPRVLYLGGYSDPARDRPRGACRSLLEGAEGGNDHDPRRCDPWAGGLSPAVEAGPPGDRRLLAQ